MVNQRDKYFYIFISSNLEMKFFWGHCSSCHDASFELGWDASAFLFFWTLFCLHMLVYNFVCSYIWLITESVKVFIALTRNADTIVQAAFNIIFPDWDIFQVFRPLQVVHVTLSCEAERKEIRKFGGGRVWEGSVEDPFFPLI